MTEVLMAWAVNMKTSASGFFASTAWKDDWKDFFV
jgi:hypothetical protein